jgi:aldose 1-epimerase
MATTSDRIVTLSAGDLVLELAPSVGGIIAGFRVGSTLLMRQPDYAAIAAGSPRGGASWPLVPYSNRIRNARFPWRGRMVQLQTDALGREHAIHGDGWRKPWSVHEQSASAVVLKQNHPPDSFWPFAYEAQQGFALTAKGFTLWMALTNTGDETMPAGLGHHPYFHRTPDARLTAATRMLWENDSEALPLRKIATPPTHDFRKPRQIDPLGVDGVFVGWTRPARIDWPGARVALEIDADALFDRLVIYIPPGQPFFAVEPVSHDTDAVNRPGEDTGLRTLSPGETLQGSMTFKVTRI